MTQPLETTIREIVYHESDVKKLLLAITATIERAMPNKTTEFPHTFTYNNEVCNEDEMIGWNRCLDHLTANLAEEGIIIK